MCLCCGEYHWVSTFSIIFKFSTSQIVYWICLSSTTKLKFISMKKRKCHGRLWILFFCLRKFGLDSYSLPITLGVFLVFVDCLYPYDFYLTFSSGAVVFFLLLLFLPTCRFFRMDMVSRIASLLVCLFCFFCVADIATPTFPRRVGFSTACGAILGVGFSVIREVSLAGCSTIRLSEGKTHIPFHMWVWFPTFAPDLF